MTLISVVMPVLNGGPWLRESIDSILCQTHGELELIVVDDGSTDDSRDIALAAAARDQRVRPIFLPPLPGNTSSARAANAGIVQARGSHIARMDADDVALPHRLERQLTFLDEGGLDACGTLAQAFGTSQQLYWYPETGTGIERELMFRVGILHPTLLARAELMRRHPYLIAASHEDYEWQVRICAAGARLGNVQEVLLHHRTHDGQANRRHRALFLRDIRQYRFQHIMRLFPGTRPAAYQPLAWLVEGAELAGDELEAAGNWLIHLADHPDPMLREKMALRWRQACDRAGLNRGDVLRERIEKQIFAGSGGE